MVVYYIEYSDADSFEPFQIQVAIEYFSNTEITCGNLTAIVRYWTPYVYKDGFPFILSFGFGKSIAVRSTIGIINIIEWLINIDVGNNQLVAPVIITIFPLLYKRAKSGLPDGVKNL